MAQLCAVGPHAQLAQPLKLTGICGGGPLLAFACPLSPHTFLPGLPFPLTYYVPDLKTTIYNAAYAKQTHSKNVSKNLSSSLHNCLHSQNLEALIHIPRPKGQIYKTLFLHSFRADSDFFFRDIKKRNHEFTNSRI